MPRCLQSLPKRKHVGVISKFAQLEFRFGTVERGRTIFEDLLATYPKRIDIWSVYLDQETKHNDIDKIRMLYDKITSMNLATKKMKYFFKRFLSFEGKVGDADRIRYVKDKANVFVQKNT